MIFIGKIVYNESLLNHKPLPYIFYQNLKDTPKDDKKLPTLIVGWKLINELIKNYEHDILERELFLNKKHRHFWEFSSTEDVIQYTNGLDLFIKRLPYIFINNFEYKNADPIFNNLFTIEQLNQFLPNGGNLYVYKNEMVYYNVNNVIYGIKLVIYESLGIKTQEVIDCLIKKSQIHCLDDSTEYQKYYKLFPEFGLLKRSMVVFMFS